MKRWIFTSLFLVASICHAADVELLQQSTVDTNALTFADGNQTSFGNFPNGITHQQFPLRTYRGYQYAVYFDDDRQVCVGRRKLPAGAWDVIRLTDYTMTSHDTHNVAVLGICENDGTIHLTFDHHRSNLHYRRSAVGVANDPEAFAWDASLFGPTTNVLGPLGAITQVTYPRFISTPGGDLLLYYRYFTSGNGDGMLRMYDGTTSQWTTSRGKFIARDIGTYSFGGASSNFRYAYLNGIGYAGNRLHVSWVWRDLFTRTDVNNQHDLCYAYSDDDGLTWNNSAGTQIGVTGSSFIHLNSPGLVVAAIDPNTDLSNQTTQYAYPDGGVHVILRHHASGTSSTRYHHHWRDPAGNWSFENLGFAGSRPELVGDDQRNLFMIYTSGGRLNIEKGVPNAGLTAWNWSTIYQQSGSTTAGDGQIDLTRWQSERVLSSYNQERPSTILDYGSGTPINGLPTPLHVTDFQVALRAAQPDPAHQAMGVATTNGLAWTAGLDALSHRIYVGTDSSSVATATTASPEYKGEQPATSYSPVGGFAGQTTYYWRIDEVAAGAILREGLLWSFTTGDHPLTISTVPDQVMVFNTAAPTIPFTVSYGTNSADDLVVSGVSSNNVLVPNDNLVFGGSGSNRTVTVTPAAGEFGFADIVLHVSNGSASRSTVFRFTVLPPGVVPGTVLSDGADCSIRETPAIEKLTDAIVDLGARGASPWVERCTVYVFPLPDLGAVSNPFADAAFTLNYISKNTTLRDHDLYGLGRRASSTVLTSDFYSQSTTTDPTDATRLQTSMLTDSTPVGRLSTSSGGSSNLVTYLNAHYAGGAGAGQYVFLRLNSTSPKSTISYATITMSEGGVAGPPDTRPRIDYVAIGNTAPYSTDIPDQIIFANTNTGPIAFMVGDDAAPSSITLTGSSSNTGLVPAANIVFGGSGSNRTVTVTPAVGQDGDAEIYIIANDGVLSSTNTFTLTVQPPPPPPPQLIAGWDTWDSAAAPSASVLAPNVAASAVTTTDQLAWNVTDERGASNHDDIDHSLTGLADHTLGAGESVEFLLAFSSGEGDGTGGHDLWVDNVALTGSILPITEPPVLNYNISGVDMVFSWSDPGFKLQTATNILPGVAWFDVPGGDASPFHVTPAVPLSFYRLAAQ